MPLTHDEFILERFAKIKESEFKPLPCPPKIHSELHIRIGIFARFHQISYGDADPILHLLAEFGKIHKREYSSMDSFTHSFTRENMRDIADKVHVTLSFDSYYRAKPSNYNSCIVLYNITDGKSYDSAEKYFNQATQTDIEVALIGLGLDLSLGLEQIKDDRAVSKEEAETLVKEYSKKCWEASLYTDSGSPTIIQAAVTTLIRDTAKQQHLVSHIPAPLASCGTGDPMSYEHLYTRECDQLISIALKHYNQYELAAQSRWKFRILDRQSPDRKTHFVEFKNILLTTTSSADFVTKMLQLKDNISTSHKLTKWKIPTTSSLLAKTIDFMLKEMAEKNTFFKGQVKRAADAEKLAIELSAKETIAEEGAAGDIAMRIITKT